MNTTEAVARTALNSMSRVSGRLAGAGTFTLFHMPLARSKMRSSERELTGAAHVEKLAVNGRSAVTYRWGDGARPVLLVHGWQSRGSRFGDFVPGLLDQGYSVITFDAPGHGDASGRSASIRDYQAVITELHDRYGTFEAIVAHSLGVLATLFAVKHGVKTEKIVTISGVCDFDYLVEEFCSALSLRPQLKAELHVQVAKRLFPGEPADRTPFSAVNATDDVRSPILAIHDEDDTRIEPGQSRRLVGAFGDQARLITTQGLGHRRILGDPHVVRTVLEFVEHGSTRTAEVGMGESA